MNLAEVFGLTDFNDLKNGFMALIGSIVIMAILLKGLNDLFVQLGWFKPSKAQQLHLKAQQKQFESFKKEVLRRKRLREREAKKKQLAANNVYFVRGYLKGSVNPANKSNFTNR